MKILITGSSGQLGAAVAELLAPDHDLLGLDPSPGRWTTHSISLTDRDAVFWLLKDVDAVVHTASLHARHLSSHTQTDFVQVNVQGTLNLLEACRAQGVSRLVYTSTTSLYGRALAAPDRAVWVTEDLPPFARDIYDVTKLAAEDLCQVHAAPGGLTCVSLRVGRFFPEPDYLTAIYRLYRGLDARDAAQAHALALSAPLSGFQVFNISAQTPFRPEDCPALASDAASVIRRRCPEAEDWFARRGWELPATIDRVYVIDRARAGLGYEPRYNFGSLFQTDSLPAYILPGDPACR